MIFERTSKLPYRLICGFNQRTSELSGEWTFALINPTITFSVAGGSWKMKSLTKENIKSTKFNIALPPKL